MASASTEAKALLKDAKERGRRNDFAGQLACVEEAAELAPGNAKVHSMLDELTAAASEEILDAKNRLRAEKATQNELRAESVARAEADASLRAAVAATPAFTFGAAPAESPPFTFRAEPTGAPVFTFDNSKESSGFKFTPVFGGGGGKVADGASGSPRETRGAEPGLVNRSAAPCAQSSAPVGERAGSSAPMDPVKQQRFEALKERVRDMQDLSRRLRDAGLDDALASAGPAIYKEVVPSNRQHYPVTMVLLRCGLIPDERLARLESLKPIVKPPDTPAFVDSDFQPGWAPGWCCHEYEPERIPGPAARNPARGYHHGRRGLRTRPDADRAAGAAAARRCARCRAALGGWVVLQPSGRRTYVGAQS